MVEIDLKIGSKQGVEQKQRIILSKTETQKICQDFFNSKSYVENNTWIKNRHKNIEKLKSWKTPNDPIVLVFPFYSKDQKSADILMNWICELDHHNENICVLHCDNQTDYKSVLQTARKCFKEVQISIYNRRELPWPSSNSYAFVKASDYMDANLPNKSWLWMETDGIPTKKLWLKRLDIAYKDSNMPFFGNVVSVGSSKHMNGLGIYPPDIRAWTSRAFEIELRDDCESWDMAMKDETIQYTQTANDLIDHVWFVDSELNPSFNDGIIPSFKNRDQVNKLVSPKTLIFHRNKDLSLIKFLK